MIADLLRFNRELRRLLARDEGSGETLGDFLARHRFSRAFVDRLIVPQVSAVWSADPRQMHSFPVRFLAEFFANHGMLGFRDRPHWTTVAGGSARYVEALTRPFQERIRLDSPVHSIARHTEHVEITAAGREGGWGTEYFDQVVIAIHSDQALALLRDPPGASARSSARFPTSATRLCSTPIAPCSRAGAARAPRGTSTCCASPRR